MYISELRIKNFKSFKDATFHFNSELNVFTGINNAGKTTVLEAIALWHECFTKTIIKASKKNQKYKYNSGDFIFPAYNRYFSYDDIVSIRNPNYNSIFYNFDEKNSIILEAVLKKNDIKLILPFEIRRASGNVYHISQYFAEDFDYVKFNSFFNFNQNIENFTPINIIYASPVAKLKTNEAFETDPKIKKAVNSRDSVAVLRNRLYNMNRLKPDKFKELKSNLSYILLGKHLPEDILFNFNSDKQKHISVDVEIKIQNRISDISLVGSGTLQIIEILLSVFEEIDFEDISIVLLDEPDSHIHRDIQNRLFETLMKHVEKNEKRQVFISTHNEGLIRSTHPKFLFHLESNGAQKYYPVISQDIWGIKKGFQPSPNVKILESIGSNSGLDILNAIEADKIILVEGKSDAKMLQILINQKNTTLKVVYWSFDGIDEMFLTIQAIKIFFKKIKNSKTLWEKSVLVFDKDKHSESERIKLELAFYQKLGIKTHIWKSYTFEAVIFSDLTICANLMELLFSYSYNYTIDIEQIKNKIQLKLLEIVQNKRKEIETIETAIENNQKHIYKDLHGYFTKRKDFLYKLNITDIISDDEIILLNYIQEYKKILDVKTIHTLMTKDDVFVVLESLIKEYSSNFELNKNSYFFDILNLVNFNIWYPDWKNFVDNLVID